MGVCLCVLIGWMFACIGLYGMTEEERNQPLRGWRRRLRVVLLLCTRTVFFSAGFPWVTVRGRRASARDAPIIAVAPHSSYFDVLPVIVMAAPSVVAKIETSRAAMFGKLIDYTQPVYVSREDPNSRQNTIREIQRRAHSNGQWPQAALMTVFVLSFRIMGVCLCVLIGWMFACIGLYGMTEEERNQPLRGWRRRLRVVLLLCTRTVFFSAGFPWVTVRGRRASARDAPIIAVAPHSSYFDVLPVIVMAAPSVVAKIETSRAAMFGKLIDYTQPVYVSREDPNSRQNTIREIQRRAHSNGQWPQVYSYVREPWSAAGAHCRADRTGPGVRSPAGEGGPTTALQSAAGANRLLPPPLSTALKKSIDETGTPLM
ncbi:uncharacterized protein LOC122390822 isoform X1 [Amphibalanus amphitrite]|uniref:uncharacterized protein LOC122390822 isoform X1 n=1 Tax=Amphibalanus amphitrite TaxID=1232801 RepID=UPI001C9271D1|nr:uncharacterized protein LOC122390822 isoform X1 [Amphibalanus amphitrite]